MCHPGNGFRFYVMLGMVEDHFNLGYKQIWLYAMRYYRKMPEELKKKKRPVGKDTE